MEEEGKDLLNDRPSLPQPPFPKSLRENIGKEEWTQMETGSPPSLSSSSSANPPSCPQLGSS